MSRQKRNHLRAVKTHADAQPTVHMGEVLRAHREAAGLTQEVAGAMAGLTRNTIRALEREEFSDPHLGTMLRLMRAYGLASLEELLGIFPSQRLAIQRDAEDAGYIRRPTQ